MLLKPYYRVYFIMRHIGSSMSQARALTTFKKEKKDTWGVQDSLHNVRARSVLRSALAFPTSAGFKFFSQ